MGSYLRSVLAMSNLLALKMSVKVAEKATA